MCVINAFPRTSRPVRARGANLAFKLELSNLRLLRGPFLVVLSLSSHCPLLNLKERIHAGLANSTSRTVWR